MRLSKQKFEQLLDELSEFYERQKLEELILLYRGHRKYTAKMTYRRLLSYRPDKMPFFNDPVVGGEAQLDLDLNLLRHSYWELTFEGMEKVWKSWDELGQLDFMEEWTK